ncbi:Carboxyvinyl-carboxyphosphonate phosphorylmutase [Falsiruegeria litorea R37]|uniref:Carboxyvinyl-carboxyphosphonate phosphorylmutase n=1 Tax=Falsiruegeria litorea R37 TaxID=1200284 RepID=A0A1Y5TBK4_9RHOB|nr:isocitrate lyase/phosphoenolpyruvate mutase family protein [Falsiruegeria litorea]SLN60259.1 Carboxyvinyl-carboxyphosphonate phosphorylmutase [Falsiruegeria litorea R37]
MTQSDTARTFADLHRPGTPLILYNAWDAGSAKAIAKAGAPAIATGSWSLAHAQGFDDGQDMPLEFALHILARITTSVDLPVSFDFEAGYTDDLGTLATNMERVIAAGAVGVNFEDRVIGSAGLLAVSSQAERIATLRRAAQSTDVPIFINARCDIFFQGAKPEAHPELMAEAIERAQAYAQAGADGFFVPGLVTPELIGGICAATSLPVNIMQTGNAPDHQTLADLGVARISHGPAPYLTAMAGVTEAAKAALAL